MVPPPTIDKASVPGVGAAGVKNLYFRLDWEYKSLVSGSSLLVLNPRHPQENYDSDLSTKEPTLSTEYKHTATMTLPKGGKQSWSLIMQGETPVPDKMNPGSPIVMAYARFDDGTQVAGGVYKSENPEYNVKFMWVFDADGNQYPGWPIDVSDDEDFDSSGYAFSLTDDPEDADYLLEIVEAQS